MVLSVVDSESYRAVRRDGWVREGQRDREAVARVQVVDNGVRAVTADMAQKGRRGKCTWQQGSAR